MNGKKEGRKVERGKCQEGINKCVPRIKCKRIGHWSRRNKGMKKGRKGRKKGRKEGRKVVSK